MLLLLLLQGLLLLLLLHGLLLDMLQQLLLLQRMLLLLQMLLELLLLLVHMLILQCLQICLLLQLLLRVQLLVLLLQMVLLELQLLLWMRQKRPELLEPRLARAIQRSPPLVIRTMRVPSGNEEASAQVRAAFRGGPMKDGPCSRLISRVHRRPPVLFDASQRGRINGRNALRIALVVAI